MTEEREVSDLILSYGNCNTKRINVEVEMLDYDYVHKCNDTSALKAILRKLITTNEGRAYPHLQKTVEDKILDLLPIHEKKIITDKLERKWIIGKTAIDTPYEVIQNEVQQLSKWSNEIMNDLAIAVSNKHVHDKEGSNFLQGDAFPIREKRVPVDDSTKTTCGTNADRNNTAQKSSNTVIQILDENKKAENSSSTITATKSQLKKEKLSTREYYNAWDKFDIKAAENEIDGNGIDGKKSILSNGSGKSCSDSETENCRKEEKSPQDLLLDLTPLENRHQATRENDKGNEYFKSQEYEKAVECYTKSIHYDKTNDPSASNPSYYANRAMALIKLQNYHEALVDCNKALNINPYYTKVLARRGMIYYQWRMYEDAKHDFYLCLNREPNNKEYQRLFRLLDRKCGKEEKPEKGDKDHEKEKQNENKNHQQNDSISFDVASTKKNVVSDDKLSKNMGNDIVIEETTEDDELIEEIYTPGFLRKQQESNRQDTKNININMANSKSERNDAIGKKSDTSGKINTTVTMKKVKIIEVLDDSDSDDDDTF